MAAMRSRSSGTTARRKSAARPRSWRNTGTLAEQPGKPARKEGDAAAALKGAAKLITATYEFPYLAHAPMEPLDAVVKLDADSCEIWCGDQFQTVDQANAARDRGAQAGAGEDPHAARRRQLRPARQHGLRLYRRGGLDRQGARRQRHAGQAAVDARRRHSRRALSPDLPPSSWRRRWTTNGQLVGWQHRIVGQSIIAGTPFAAVMVKNGIDGTSVEGAANLPYAIPNMSVELTHDRDRRAGIMVARRRQFAHRLRDRSLHRRDRACGRQGSVRLPPGDCSNIIRATKRCWSLPPRRPAGATRCRKARAAASPSPRRSAPTSRRSPK